MSGFITLYKQLHLIFAGQIEVVATAADLPTVGVLEGGIRYVADTDTVYTYNGIAWTALLMNGGSGSFSSLTVDTLTVNNFSYLNSNVVEIGDNIVLLNNDVTGVPTEDSGLMVNRGALTNALLQWNETTDTWEAGTVGNMHPFANAMTPSRAAVTDGFGYPTTSTTTATEIGFIAGLTSNAQTQLNGKQPLDSDLTALAALTTTGVLVRTGAGTATTRTITGTAGQITVANGDGVSANPTLSLTAVGTAGTYKSPASITTGVDGRVTAVTAGNDFPIDPTLLSVQFDDWISSLPAGDLGWVTTKSGAGSTDVAGGAGSEAFNKAQGAATFGTGTTTTGRVALSLGTPMGIGYTSLAQQWRPYISPLSTAGEEYSVLVGWGDTPAGAGITQTNGIFFSYNRLTSVNWLCTTIAAGVSTQTVTTIPVTTGFSTLRITINNTGTSAIFKVNGVIAATHTTNIPGFEQFVGPLIKIAKSAGTTARLLTVDYFWQTSAWAVAR